MSKKPVVTVIDYGIGNLLSVSRGLAQAGAEVIVTQSPLAVAHAEKLVVPGVGAFGDVMAELRSHGFAEPVVEFAKSGKPLLGICVGMQMLMEGSDEFDAGKGLGLIPGWVKSLPVTPGIKLPHIGWSAIRPREGATWADTPLQAVEPGGAFYFVHSFHPVPQDPADVWAIAEYASQPACVAVKRGNVMGTQFHPEKSGEAGLAMLAAFVSG